MTGDLCKDTHRTHSATAIYAAADITAIYINKNGIIVTSDIVGTSEIIVDQYLNDIEGIRHKYVISVSDDRIHVINLGLSGQAILLESNGKYALISMDNLDKDGSISLSGANIAFSNKFNRYNQKG